jgi:GxxExxY protein
LRFRVAVEVAETATIEAENERSTGVVGGMDDARWSLMSEQGHPERHINEITAEVVRAAVRVHRGTGPGLLESVYQACMIYELLESELAVHAQKPLPVNYRDVRLDCGYRVDLFVANRLIVEIKSIEKLGPVHIAQMITYLKLSGCTVGLILNFNVPLMKQGIRRVVLGHEELSPKTPHSCGECVPTPAVEIPRETVASRSKTP